MEFIKTIVLAVALFFCATVTSADELVEVSDEQICSFFGQDALDLALIYTTPGKTKEDMAQHVADRIEKMPGIETFLPGDLLIMTMLTKFSVEELLEPDYITTFGQIAEEQCLKSINVVPYLWIQEVPGASKIIHEKPEPEKVQI